MARQTKQEQQTVDMDNRIKFPTEAELLAAGKSIIDWLDEQPAEVKAEYWQSLCESYEKEKSDRIRKNSEREETIRSLQQQIADLTAERDLSIKKYNNLMRLYNILFTHNINDM